GPERGLFGRRSLLDRRFFDLAPIALVISFVQELADDACTSLLLGPNLLRFLLFNEDVVIYFPAHRVLHPRRNERQHNAAMHSTVPIREAAVARAIDAALFGHCVEYRQKQMEPPGGVETHRAGRRFLTQRPALAHYRMT